MSVRERVEQISQNHNLSLDTPYTTAKIELTGVCTLQCAFCYNKQMRKNNERQKFLSQESFKIILDNLAQIPTLQEVGLFYMGESGLHPDLATFYRMLKERGYFTYLTTNGTVDKIIEAIPYIDSLKVSWNYKNFADFQNKTGCSAVEYFHIKDNIKFFKMICNFHGKPLAVSTVLDGNRKDYKHELSQLDYDEHYWIPLQNQGGSYSNGMSGVVGEDDHKVSPIPCWSLFKGIYIDVNLNVRTCCYGHREKHILGNLKEEPLPKILGSERLLQIKQEHLNGNIPDICQECLSCQEER